MNGFLVVLTHLSDDFPMGLFSTAVEAAQFAEKLPWEVYGESHPFKRDATTPLVIRVVEFIDGLPRTDVEIRHFQEEF